MKLVKPQSLGLLTRPFRYQGKDRLGVAALGFFELGGIAPRFIPEAGAWAKVQRALPGKAVDEVYPKSRGEVLLAGAACAPRGEPVDRLDVRLCLGRVDKRIRVWGDRRWYYGPWYRITPPQPFLRIPIDDKHSYGGPRHPTNPDGRGYTGNPIAGWIGQNEGDMPNVESPEAPVRGHVAAGDPAGFGPLDPSRAPRVGRAGTYGQDWLLTDAPGLARDLDPRFFQTAREDQWNDGPWRGDEPYRLEHLHPAHPCIEGRLPGFGVRALVREKAGGAVREVAMAPDTVWFFPEELLGLVVFHGAAEVADRDGLDLDAILVAWEAAPRPRAHYEEALRLRTDPEVAVYHLLDDGPLSAPRPAEELAARSAARAERRRRELAERQAIVDEIHAEATKQIGGEPTPTPVVERSPLELDMEAVQDGEEDLGAWVARAREQAKKAKQEGEARLAAMKPEEKGAPPPVSERDRAAVVERAERPANFDDPIAAQQRKGRCLALEPQAAPLAPSLAILLGETVRALLAKGERLAGRDLSGAMLAGVDFSGADLRETCFESADLTGARFAGANLAGAGFTGAILDGADLRDARLDGAGLNACRAHGARFDGVSARGAMGVRADLTSACFDGAALPGVVWSEAVLAGASFRRARFEDALLSGAQAAGSTFTGAELRASILLKADLRGADLREAVLVRCLLLDAVLDDADLRQAQLDTTLAIGASALRLRAGGLRCKNAGFRNTRLHDADLSFALCNDSDFGDAELSRAVLAGALFARCLFQGARLDHAQARGADFFQAICRKADLRGADLRDVSFRQATLDGARFDEADLTGARLDAAVVKRLDRQVAEARG